MKHFFSMVLVTVLSLTASCARDASEPHEHADAEAIVKGPHNGRLLSDGSFQVEVTIFERGVPPEFHIYTFDAGKPLDPEQVHLNIELTRFGGRKDAFTFTRQDDFLRGTGVVEEPHSFDVHVTTEYQGKRREWTYESYEGRTRIMPDIAGTAGIETATAGPGVLRDTTTLYGSIRVDAERVRQVSARFPGLIRSVAAKVGEQVAAGAALAVIESNESLQSYTLTAPIAGIVTERNANPGETAGGAPLFVVSDFGNVWAELNVFPRDRSQLKSGQAVRVSATDGVASANAVLGPVTNRLDNQALVARVVLDNRDGRWTPGQFVTAAVTVAERNAPLVIPAAALQKFRDWDVVFLNIDDTYQAMPLELGKNDGKSVEVLGGLEAGQRYVVANSYLVKADIEKSGASHDH